MKWAGHTVRMKDERLSKRSETKKRGGCRKRGRPQIRWEDCVKRDIGNVLHFPRKNVIILWSIRTKKEKCHVNISRLFGDIMHSFSQSNRAFFQSKALVVDWSLDELSWQINPRPLLAPSVPFRRLLHVFAHVLI